MKKTAIFIIIISFTLSGCAPKKTNNTDYVVAIGEDSDIVDKVRNIDVLVIDADYFSAEEIAEMKRNNVREIYSYLNIGSIEKFRDYYEQYEAYTLGEYENWPDEKWIDVSDSNWQEFVAWRADELSKKGVDGFFIDNTDVYYLYHSDEMFQGIVDVLSAIRKTGKKVIINGGDYFVETYLKSANNDVQLFDGVNQESVFTKYDFSTKTFTRNSEEEINYYTEYLDMLMKNGYDVYVLEYATDPEIINEATGYLNKRGYKFYISDNIELKKMASL